MSAFSWACFQTNWNVDEEAAAVYGRTCGGGRKGAVTRYRDLAESVSRLRNRDCDAGVYLGLPEDGVAGPWHAALGLHAAPALPGVEIAEDVYARLSQPGNLSGERRESFFGGCGES